MHLHWIETKLKRELSTDRKPFNRWLPGSRNLIEKKEMLKVWYSTIATGATDDCLKCTLFEMHLNMLFVKLYELNKRVSAVDISNDLFKGIEDNFITVSNRNFINFSSNFVELIEWNLLWNWNWVGLFASHTDSFGVTSFAWENVLALPGAEYLLTQSTEWMVTQRVLD